MNLFEYYGKKNFGVYIFFLFFQLLEINEKKNIYNEIKKNCAETVLGRCPNCIVIREIILQEKGC